MLFCAPYAYVAHCRRSCTNFMHFKSHVECPVWRIKSLSHYNVIQCKYLYVQYDMYVWCIITLVEMDSNDIEASGCTIMDFS